jgi:predicted RNA binding protein YcfA (HicA-like mRNA interferase family)
MQSFPLSQIPLISGLKAVKAFEKAGWIVVRQSGSHLHMNRVGSDMILTIPQHRELKRATLKNIVRTSGLSLDEFKKLL